jgi:hypothetical protein
VATACAQHEHISRDRAEDLRRGLRRAFAQHREAFDATIAGEARSGEPACSGCGHQVKDEALATEEEEGKRADEIVL